VYATQTTNIVNRKPEKVASRTRRMGDGLATFKV